MWLWRLVYDLVEVDCEGIVVPLVRGHNLVIHFFTLKHDSPTQSWADIHDPLDTLSLWEQAQHSFFRIWQLIKSIEIVIQEDYHAKLAQYHTVNFIIFVVNVRVLMAKILLIPC